MVGACKGFGRILNFSRAKETSHGSSTEAPGSSATLSNLDPTQVLCTRCYRDIEDRNNWINSNWGDLEANPAFNPDWRR